MLAKLQQLEQTLAAITTQYHVVATELANLKNKPDHQAEYERTILELSQKFDHSQDTLLSLQEAHKSMGVRVEELATTNEQLLAENNALKAENDALKAKNRLAMERAEVVQTWLRTIDGNATNKADTK
ncbi:MAG: hypothetical protein Q4C68_05550 [Moraxella sp.]|nr:hypothetical protein [Moraxella sp.]